MCGIHGILDLTGAPVPAEVLSRMGRVTRHRGPDGEGIRADGALAPLLRQLLSRESVERRGLFRHEAVSALIATHEANRIDGTDRLLAPVNSESWARLYLDGRAPGDVVDELKVAAA